MGHEPGDGVAAYLAGDLDVAATAAFETHLLDCDGCWEAVRSDRAGRAAAEQLRELAPPGLADRIGASIELTAVPRRARPRLAGRRSRLAAAGAGVLAVSAVAAWAGGHLTIGHRGAVRDPAVIVELVSLAGRPGPDGPVVNASAAATTFTVTRMTAGGVTVVVARSADMFAMPDRAVPMTSAADPWVARRGQVTLVCLNTPHPVLVAAALPADRLEVLAHQLDQAS